MVGTTIVFIVITSAFMMHHWINRFEERGDGFDIGEETYAFSEYAQINLNGNLIFDNVYISERTMVFAILRIIKRSI